MAWADQCKIAFNTTAEGLIHKRGGKGVVKVLRQISKESGIPYGTLRRWYYPNEKKIPKNGNKRRPSQETVWKNVARRMESLVKYMMENCETPAEISDETRRSALDHADNIRSSFERLKIL